MTDPEKMIAAVHAYIDAFDKGNPDAVVALFAPDGKVEDPVGGPVQHGHDAIRAFYAANMETGAKLKLEGPIRVTGDHAAFPFSVTLHYQGKDQRIDVIDTFRFDEAGKVVEMRAYFGPTNMHGF
ncbi:steroid Delta-isomerase [Sphingobium sp. WCS2017Hpa-17]|uniref:steroid Delta-isomerase n=1 Tax=Sphingobium sp. WCS2017Hpa-17 TaxID=3073638 RepID=UPI00288B4E29|nr:steroid Delta-isomerase [Sphingobium sp. WCS2017Hpa-17]